MCSRIICSSRICSLPREGPPSDPLRTGFTSDSPERGGQVLELQAQSIAEAYQAAKANPYVEGFFLNRMHDEPSLLGAHYAFGLIGTDGTKKPAWQTYKDLQ